MIGRRGFLKGVMASVAVATAGSSVKAATPEPFANFKTILNGIPAHTKAALFGDTNHNKPLLLEPFEQRDIMQHAAGLGYTDMYAEVPRECQAICNELYLGNIDHTRFIRNMHDAWLSRFDGASQDPLGISQDVLSRKATTIKACAQAGIRFHCADLQPIDQMLYADNVSGERTPEDIKAALKKRLDVYDPMIAQYIKESNQGRALVCYGNLHFVRDTRGALGLNTLEAGNIDNALRARGIATHHVAMVDADDPVRLWQSDPFSPDGRADVPDVVYATKTDSILAVKPVVPVRSPILAPLSRMP